MSSLEQGPFLVLCGCSAALSTLDVFDVFSLTILSMCWRGHDSIHPQSRSLCPIVKLCSPYTDGPSWQGWTCSSFIPRPLQACILQSIERWLYLCFASLACNWILFFLTQTHFCLPCQKGSGHRAETGAVRCHPTLPGAYPHH